MSQKPQKYSFRARLAFLFGAPLPELSTSPDANAISATPAPAAAAVQSAIAAEPAPLPVRRGVLKRKRDHVIRDYVENPFGPGHYNEYAGFVFLIACDDELGHEYLTVSQYSTGAASVLREGDRVLVRTYYNNFIEALVHNVEGDWDTASAA